MLCNLTAGGLPEAGGGIRKKRIYPIPPSLPLLLVYLLLAAAEAAAARSRCTRNKGREGGNLVLSHRMLANSPADFGSLLLHACGVPGVPRIGPGVISRLPRGAPPGYPRRHILVSPVYPGVPYRAGVE